MSRCDFFFSLSLWAWEIRHSSSCCTSLFHSNPSLVQSKVKMFCKLICFRSRIVFPILFLSASKCSRHLKVAAAVGAAPALCEIFHFCSCLIEVVSQICFPLSKQHLLVLKKKKQKGETYAYSPRRCDWSGGILTCCVHPYIIDMPVMD